MMVLIDRPRVATRIATWRPRALLDAALAALTPDDRRIARAAQQREVMLGDRPDFTVIRGKLPDFIKDQVRLR